MNGMKTEEMGSRKKYLAPVVVLLLCLVSLTGAAYAYSSSVEVTNNSITGEEYVLEVYQDTNNTKISAPIEFKGIQLFHTTSIGASNTVVVKAEATTASYVGKLTLQDTTVTGATAARTITATAEPADGSDLVVNASDLTSAGATGDGSIGYTVAVTLWTNAGCTTPYNSASVAFTSGLATLYYKVVVTVTPASATGITFGNNTAQADITAVAGALALEKYNLTFTAAQPAA